MIRSIPAIAALLFAAGCAPNAAPDTAAAEASGAKAPMPPPPSPERPEAIEAIKRMPRMAPKVMDATALERLLANKGLTLQWIDWDRRGFANIRKEEGELRLTGSQLQAGGPGELFLDGRIEEVGEDYFTFRGTIRISDTPDPGRRCEATKLWHFAITQGRSYYRLREFEWCDALTDYIDIYF